MGKFKEIKMEKLIQDEEAAAYAEMDGCFPEGILSETEVIDMQVKAARKLAEELRTRLDEISNGVKYYGRSITPVEIDVLIDIAEELEGVLR